jgi:hypothetical protein
LFVCFSNPFPQLRGLPPSQDVAAHIVRTFSQLGAAAAPRQPSQPRQYACVRLRNSQGLTDKTNPLIACAYFCLRLPVSSQASAFAN